MRVRHNMRLTAYYTRIYLLYMYTTTLTTQGTITLPVELRRKYDLQPGAVLTIEDADAFVIHKVPTITEVRARNKKFVTAKTKAAARSYRQGDGVRAYVTEKYGKR